jgi:hypothetical protein
MPQIQPEIWMLFLHLVDCPVLFIDGAIFGQLGALLGYLWLF